MSRPATTAGRTSAPCRHSQRSTDDAPRLTEVARQVRYACLFLGYENRNRQAALQWAGGNAHG